MQSDRRVAAALSAVAPRLHAYRAALSDAVERVDRYLGPANPEFPRDRVAAELGAYAADRIDADRFGELFGGAPALDKVQRAVLAAACDVMRTVAAFPEDDFIVNVPAGGRPGALIGERLAELGRAFGAAQVADLVKSHRYDPGTSDAALASLPQSKWSRAERLAAPPIIAVIGGEDLWAAEVSPLLDGKQSIVFVVRGACPPAPLARLIAPSVLVQQTSRPDALIAVTTAEGPTVAALVPEGCAEFVHTPSNAAVHERLSVTVSAAAPRRAIGAWSARQQMDDLQLLTELATPSAAKPTPIPGAPVGKDGDPVEQLAGWLLSQAAG